jgi:hypothetical protein
LVWRGWKYLIQSDGRATREELHPLGDESRNLVRRKPRVLERMRAAYRASRDRSTAAPAPIERELSPPEQEQLRALGYGVDSGS